MSTVIHGKGYRLCIGGGVPAAGSLDCEAKYARHLFDTYFKPIEKEYEQATQEACVVCQDGMIALESSYFALKHADALLTAAITGIQQIDLDGQLLL